MSPWTQAGRAPATLLSFALAAILGVHTPRPAAAQSFTFSSLYAFYGVDGTQPVTSLLQASDGNLYGTTSHGGFSGDGTLFRISLNGAYEVLHTFAGSDGEDPTGTLIQASDGDLYGTTSLGGANNLGTVFKIGLDGTFTLLHSFAGGSTDGSQPAGGLLQASDGNFYGTTPLGGAGNLGTVFRMTSAGTVTLLHTFAGGTSDGAKPQDSLIEAKDGNLYGTTSAGGSANIGTAFKITLAGAQTLLHTFKGGSGDGSDPASGLIQASDGNFYGTTLFGGASGLGTAYKMTSAGAVTLLHSFGGGTADDSLPFGPLLQASDGNFYGTTTGAAGKRLGVVFKITPTGTETTLYSFKGGDTDGAVPQAGVIQASDGNLYGTTNNGGSSANDGVVFKVSLSGTESLLHSFPTNDGGDPFGALLQASDGNFYGTTALGGAGNNGTVFKMTPNGVVSVIYSFVGGSSDGVSPTAGLVEGADGNFYGTTSNGGGSNLGTVFKITPAGGETVLHFFAGGSDGAKPVAGLILASDGNFYGTTEFGGAGNKGIVFKITSTGLEGVLYSFAGGNADGAIPAAGLIQASDGNFYGTTFNGGATGNGTVFKISPSGTESVLHSFTGGSDGAIPTAGLIQASDSNFYGTTLDGGVNSQGTVFKITPSGTETVLYSFAGNNADGAEPGAGLIQASDGNFIGTTTRGGTSNLGTIFEVSPSGLEAVLHSFTGVDGAFPQAGLVLASDGSFYGTTSGDGTDNQGTVFVLSPSGPTLSSLSPSSKRACSSSFTLIVNGANFVSGAVVDWNGADLTTTFVSASELKASVPASLIANPGTASITVEQSGATSDALTFTITNPLPVLSSISPSSANAGSPAFTLIVKGKCFLSSSKVDWNGTALTTTFVSATELKASVPASLIAKVGTAKVTVVTPAPGGGASTAKTFTIL